jgi:hypothetical protein
MRWKNYAELDNCVSRAALKDNVLAALKDNILPSVGLIRSQRQGAAWDQGEPVGSDQKADPYMVSGFSAVRHIHAVQSPCRLTMG